MSVHFDPTGGFSIDLKEVIEAIRQENHHAIDRKVMAYVAYHELSQLRNQMDGKLRHASKKSPEAFDLWIQGYVRFDTGLLRTIICSRQMYKWGLTNSHERRLRLSWEMSNVSNQTTTRATSTWPIGTAWLNAASKPENC